MNERDGGNNERRRAVSGLPADEKHRFVEGVSGRNTNDRSRNWNPESAIGIPEFLIELQLHRVRIRRIAEQGGLAPRETAPKTASGAAAPDT
jgi:hypothetical protein